MTGNSPSTDRPAQGVPQCVLCFGRLPSHTILCPLHPAYFGVKAGGALNVYRAVLERVTERPPLRGDGSSSTTTGSTRSRGWSVTGSSGLVCRRLKRVRSVPIWTAVKSQRGTATGRTSGSWKSWPEAVDIIGQAARIPADLHHGPIHDAVCPICKERSNG